LPLRLSTITRLCLGLCSSLLSTACGNDDGTSPDSMGRAQVFIRDHPDRSAPAASLAPGPFAAATFSGTVTSNTNVAVSADGSTWIDLGSPNGITIRMQSADSTTVHGEVDVPAGTYARVRLTLRNAQAKLLAGGSVAGISLASDLTLTVGGTDSQVIVEKQVQPFEVRAGSRTAIQFELNSESWATAQNTQDRTVEDGEVQQAATILVRAGS
jgi:hypothetical protein